LNKCIFLDRDGVLNVERGDYTYQVEDFIIPGGVIPMLQELKDAGFLLIVITNQGGISKGIYSVQQMQTCHEYLQNECGGIINAFYYSPYHQTITNSLASKPGTLMFEKAIARFNIDTNKSWMIGDHERDLIPAHKLEINTIFIGNEKSGVANFNFKDFNTAAKKILSQ